MKKLLSILTFTVLAAVTSPAFASGEGHGGGSGKFNANELIVEHLADSYWWHVTTVNEREVTLFLPVIVRSSDGVWHLFSSRHLEGGDEYMGFRIAEEGKYKGKVVGMDATGAEYRPWDVSITKTALALMINSAIMVTIFLCVARWYRRRPDSYAPPKGFVGAVEMFVVSVEDDIIKKSIGKDYERYSPYLLTAFFFILINNVMGLMPFFPGGANVTGNIAVTLVLALFTMGAVNLFANREYWKEIFWPDVPKWLKVPVPFMPFIELFGIISKPFALMIRLMANIMAGHTVILALVCVVFIATSMGAVASAGMTIFSVLLSVFMNLLELLVGYLQAYVFTLLSAVFIGLSRPEHHKTKKDISTIKI